MTERPMMRSAVVLAQFILAGLFIFSGLVKGIDPMGTSIKIGEYAAKMGLPIAESIAMGLSVLLNVFEALLGVCLLFGICPRRTSLMTLIFIVPMTLLTLYIYIFNPVSDCGCFGDAVKISNAATFWKNVVFLCLALMLYYRPLYIYRFWGWWFDVPIVVIGGVMLIYFNIYPLLNLPVVDFRPYKVGSDLYELTSGAAKEGEYDYRFVYAKDGKEKVFSIDELAELDDSWSYVRDETVEITAPVSAPGADFVLIDKEGIPETQMLSGSDKKALLFIVRDISSASIGDMEVGVQLQKQTGMPVALVTGNSFDEIHSAENADKSAPFSRFYFLDRTTAKTVIRATPGLLVISEGKIARKASLAQLKRLMKDESFVRDPYRMMSAAEQRRGLWYTFGVLGLELLVLIVLGIRKRIY